MFRNKSSLKHTWSNTQERSFSKCQLIIGESHNDTRLYKNSVAQTPFTTYLNVHLSPKNSLDKTSFLWWGSGGRVYGLSGPFFFLALLSLSWKCANIPPQPACSGKTGVGTASHILQRERIEALRVNWFSLSLMENSTSYNTKLNFLTVWLLSLNAPLAVSLWSIR